MSGAPMPGSARDPLWYKDAIIYELHVKTFCDSNGDGVGDFRGLISKLDYLAGLGVTCLWLLPFYESPLRDDGYDIAHYERVHPLYGSLSDFDQFVDAAHQRGLQVVTELVLNHTSDRHPWFQAARRAPVGSPKRDFYVWSNTDQRYRDAPVIFRDVEASNWSWDPVAAAFYWHRFFAHQPDLNFDNPSVRRAVMKVMRFWLARGVDGLRLDAVPYLFEREGSNCENLPETHQFVKRIRADVDRRFEHRILLAEANHWPADVRPYFGDGDECHMAFYFPLMPRLFMALKREDASLIVDIVSQTLNLPPNCQWAVFLRNHDELTLSAVTDEERDFLYRAYGAEPRMRLNHGIRRRLAPLLDNQRRRLDLAYALLLSLPGSPVIYYGDEIGMGDTIQLGDRDGVRTPMQWTSEVHGGFSSERATPVLPLVEEPMYSYRVLNVDAEERDSSSLLNWIKRLIRVRRRARALSRGSIDFVVCDNPRVLAFLRQEDDEQVLVTANLSGSAQSVEVQCPRGGTVVDVIDMIDGTALPPANSSVYHMILAPYACRWLQIPTCTTAIVSDSRDIAFYRQTTITSNPTFVG
jgi:maltose alpha-D-glucosyltransferase/alpha-amylase